MNLAMTYLSRNYYQNYTLINAIERGFDVVQVDESGVLVAFDYPTFFMLSSTEPLKFLDLIPKKPEVMFVVGDSAGLLAQSHFSFTNALRCYQYYYPFQSIESDLELETARLDDHDFISQHYTLADREEIRETIEQSDLWVVRDRGQIFGFIGRHQEGSMGMMHVLPEYRRRGWGERPERALIKIVLSRGELPYGHVVIGNEASARLQEKLGLVLCKEIVSWLW